MFQKPPGDEPTIDDGQPTADGPSIAAGPPIASGQPTDAELLVLLRRHGEEGLRRIFERDAAWLQARLTRELGTLAYDDEIDTAVSEALVVLHRKRGDRTISALRAYLRTTARHACLKLIKKRFNERPSSLHELGLDPAAERQGPPSEFARFLAAKVESLPAKERDLFRIDACEDRSARSAAEELGSTSGAIDTLRYRRKKRLLSWLEEWDRKKEAETND